MSLALAIAVVMMNVIDTTSASITASISIVVIYMIAFRVSVRNPNGVWTWLSSHDLFYAIRVVEPNLPNTAYV